VSFLSNLIGGGAKGIIEGVAEAADRFITTGDEKNKFVVEVEKLVTERMGMMEQSARDTVKARMEVIVAELQHGDEYTKRTRPMIARWGLYTIMWNHAAVPTLGGLVKFALAAAGSDIAAAVNVAPIDLPTEFWVAWGGIVGTYAVGRSFEKFGVRNPLTSAATGTPSPEGVADRVLRGLG
jgi:hypothetical protein